MQKDWSLTIETVEGVKGQKDQGSDGNQVTKMRII